MSCFHFAKSRVVEIEVKRHRKKQTFMIVMFQNMSAWCCLPRAVSPDLLRFALTFSKVVGTENRVTSNLTSLLNLSNIAQMHS